MTETDKELNERLLKAVFPDAIDIFPGAFELSSKTLVLLKDKPLIELRPFTVSMDSCLKWIAPVLRERGINHIEFGYGTGVNANNISCFINKPPQFDSTKIHGNAETEPLAFCLAADKFLSEEK